MVLTKFVEKQIQSRASISMQREAQHGYNADAAEESGAASAFLTFCSMILIVITFPFSLFFCMRMIQVDSMRHYIQCDHLAHTLLFVGNFLGVPRCILNAMQVLIHLHSLTV